MGIVCRAANFLCKIFRFEPVISRAHASNIVKAAIIGAQCFP